MMRVLYGIVNAPASLSQIVFPTHHIPFSLSGQAMSVSHITDRWDAHDPIHLLGYYGYSVAPLHPWVCDPPMKLSLRRETGSGYLTGSGQDGIGSFKISSGRCRDDGSLFFCKEYSGTGLKWDYVGWLLPWGIAGEYGLQHEQYRQGDFYLWLDDSQG